MFQLALSPSEEAAFNAALVAGARHLRFKAQLYNKWGNALSKPLTVFDGEVVVDDTAPKEQPSRTAHITLLDPDKQLMIDVVDPSSGDVWFSKSISLTWGIWVSDLDRWVDVPVFFGPIFSMARRGIEVDLDAQSKEAQHLPPYVFQRAFSVRRNVRVHRAIRAILDERGESGFRFDEPPRRLPRDRTWGVGQIPWKVCQNLAEALDKQLYVRGDGTFRLRNYPENPSWKFTEGRDAVVVDASQSFSLADLTNMVVVRGERTVKVQIKTRTELTSGTAVGATSISVKSAKNFAAGRKVDIGSGKSPETRTIAASYTAGSLTVPLGRALSKGHKKGAVVEVRHRADRTRRVVGRAELPSTNPLSPGALSLGKRPRVRIVDRSSIHKRKTAQSKAEKILDRMRIGTEQDISLSVLTIPHLEPGDVVKVNIGDVEKRFRLRKFSIPLSLDGEMDVNWLGTRVPRKKRR